MKSENGQKNLLSSGLGWIWGSSFPDSGFRGLLWFFQRVFPECGPHFLIRHFWKPLL